MQYNASPGLQDSGTTDEPTGYTEHREPSSQGGECYIRCCGCGRELLVCLGGRDNLLHKRDCPNARPDRRVD